MKIPRTYYKKKIDGIDGTVPKISIVTPTLNQGKFLKRTIESILGQDYPQLEYIIIDGNSNDNTNDVIGDYLEKLFHVASGDDTGQSNAINQGFERSNGNIMAWINSDDILLPGTLDYIADFFLNNPGVDVVYGHRILIDEDDKEINRWILPNHDKKSLLWMDYIPQETLFWRRSIWENVGGKINENFHYAMDWELLLRFQSAGASMVRLPRFLGAFRVHPEQKTSRCYKNGYNEIQRLRKQYLKRNVSKADINKNLFKYRLKHQFLDKLYRLGILRY